MPEVGKVLNSLYGNFKSSGCNVFVTEPITAMDISAKEPSYVAVAGRKMLKIMMLHKNGFVEVANLCGKNKKVNLDYSITDVQWEPNGDERLATAAGNGTILVWNVNLSKNSRQVNCGKRDLTEHRRTVNRISFHPTDRDVLISGSQDGTIRYFDLRRPDGIALSMSKGKSQNTSIRDVKFKPSDGRCFAAAAEIGEVQLWDIRKLDNCIQHFVAHIGPTFSIDWHPDEADWLGTAGRDKLIKVWDTQHKPVETHQIRAIAELARIKWRPGRRHHIASCALLVDNCVSVWDIRRPYLPHAQFSFHEDAVTGIVWHKDPNMLCSCGKDSMIYQNWFADAYRPPDHVSPVALGFSSTGNIAFAKSDVIVPAEPTKPKQKFNAHLTSSLGAMRIQQPSKVEEVTPVTSTMYSFTTDSVNDLERFKILARNYQLSGGTLGELCDHNAKQCSKLGLHYEAQTWKIIKVMYSCDYSELTSTAGAATCGIAKTNQGVSTPASPTVAEPINVQNSAEETLAADDQEVQNILSKKENESVVEHDESSESSDDITESETFFNPDKDFIFGEEQEFQFDSADIDAQLEIEYTLAHEAFEPRQDIEDRPLPTLHSERERYSTPYSGGDSDVATAQNHRSSIVDLTLKDDERMRSLLFPKLDFTDIVVECLEYYAKQGDVQMSVSVLLVLGDKIRSAIEEHVQEQWLLSYVDLLSRLQMWTVSTEIINLSNLPALTHINQTSTTVHTLCSNVKCRKLLPPDKPGWSCDKCKILTPACSVCNMTVRGLFAWCQGCGHGGHILHIKEWFKKYRSCPKGCGHNCEYR
ncbi:GATOR complex protein WDR24-like [Xenia sp. Carnegie-2017]|uniref:GATOR complex protein WDR24-like n=1 Tax=Xenia sp. Carnegie-2017 TaxID=2897299 RepID=UPI001F03A27C|nr:GATOR complex protein WDR24-like [Xenia sp. Carnegie-2017]